MLILAVILGAWETLTRIPWFTQNTLFDPFFISQPSRVAVRLWEWLQPGPRSVWPHLWLTLQATLIGLAVGVGSGFLVGMTLSRSRFLADVFNPYIVAFNSMPRIAFVPLITMFFGLGLASKVVTSWFVVFFLVFFNTYKGRRSVGASWWTSAARWAARRARSCGACACPPPQPGPSPRCPTPSASR